jgi:LysR family transcriptional regulator, flagellar master operon regulator
MSDLATGEKRGVAFTATHRVVHRCHGVIVGGLSDPLAAVALSCSVRRCSWRPGMALRHSLVKQLHERQLDLLITTEPPKMDELAKPAVGEFLVAAVLFHPARSTCADALCEAGMGGRFPSAGKPHAAISDTLPVLTTTSAHLTRQLLETDRWLRLPAQSHWENEYPAVNRHRRDPPVIRPLYAVWLQNSDQQPF